VSKDIKAHAGISFLHHFKTNSMTLKETTEKIHLLQHLVGHNVPKWNSPILDIIPAPADSSFMKYMEMYKKTGDYKKVIPKVRSKEYDVLLIFRTPKLHKSLVCEWYGFFYPDQAMCHETNTNQSNSGKTDTHLLVA